MAGCGFDGNTNDAGIATLWDGVRTVDLDGTLSAEDRAAGFGVQYGDGHPTCR